MLMLLEARHGVVLPSSLTISESYCMTSLVAQPLVLYDSNQSHLHLQANG